MSLILIYGIIISLIILGVNSMNNTSIDISTTNLIPKIIQNNFYHIDTKLVKDLSYCSFYDLSLTNMDINELSNCIRVPDVLTNYDMNITNDNIGEYKVCYNFKYNLFSKNTLNKDKNITNDSNNTCVNKIYNNFYNSTILNEIINFYNGNNSLTQIDLIYYDADGNRQTTFKDADNIVYNKSDFNLNGQTLFDLENIGDKVYFSNWDKNILYRYDSGNKILDIFSFKNISNSDIKIIEELRKINPNLYDITNSNINDGNIIIQKK